MYSIKLIKFQVSFFSKSIFYYLQYIKFISSELGIIDPTCSMYQILMCVDGQEELLTQKIVELGPENIETLESTSRRTAHSNVITFLRDKQPIRLEVIDSSSNFLQLICLLTF